jgi:hypothetical protein
MSLVIDALKSSLAGCSPNTPIRFQIGTDGSIVQVIASELAQALGVTISGNKKVKVTSDFLRIRAQPTVSATEVAQFKKDDTFDIVNDTPVEADNYHWYKTADGRGYIAIEFTAPADSASVAFVPPSVEEVSKSAAASSATPSNGAAVSSFQLPFTANLRGVGTSAGGWAPGPTELDLIKRNNIETAFIVTYEAGQAARAIDPLRNVGIKHFVLRACIHEAISSAQRFIDITTPILKEYATAIGSSDGLLIAIHNEVNLVQEGWTKSWRDGAEFATWWQTVAAAYRQAFPGAKMGFPAMSPGGDVPNIRLNEPTFIQQAAAAVQAADWIGIHYYWANADGSDINPPVAQWRQWFGNKPIIGTEVGPTDANTVSANAVKVAYQKFAEVGIPAMAWVLNGAGAWKNAAWDQHGIAL